MANFPPILGAPFDAFTRQEGRHVRLSRGEFVKLQEPGSAAAPVIGLGSGFDTGFFEKSDGVIGVSSNGTEVLTISSSGLDAEWQDWTPTYTNLTVGNGTVKARYAQVGDIVVANFDLTCGTTTAISSPSRVSLPVTADNTLYTNIGMARMVDISAPAEYVGSVRCTSATNVAIAAWNAAGTYASTAAISGAVPFTWATGDVLSFAAIYEAA